MEQQSIVEQKPEITIGVLGADGAGKTSLTTTITQSLARLNGSVVEGDEIVVDLGEYVDEDKSRPFVYETEARRYTHVDCHSHINVMKNLILNRIPLHGAILVVSAVDGITDQTREQVRLANIVGVSAIVVFLNKCDLTNDAELLDRIEQDVRDLLREHGYSDDDPILRGSATAALNTLETRGFDLWTSKTRELLDALDASIPAPKKLEDKPFLMHISAVTYMSGRGNTIAIGWIERGSVRINAGVEIVGFGLHRLVIGTDLGQRHKKCDHLTPGEDGEILLRGLRQNEAQRGQVLAAPGTIRAYARFKAILYLPTQQEGGSDSADLSGTDYVFSIRSVEFNGTLQLEEGTGPLRGGEAIQVTGELEASVPMEAGLRFILRQDGSVLGFGIVTEPLS
ncbi:MAG: hypothetical protein JWL77_5950 [Chthonomonadaceae bacterium]|nr:hypothetical protein [Chthonomonadaceae bacterium]